MIALIQIALVFANIAMAYHHSRIIANHRKVKHWFWGGLYLLTAATLTIAFHSWVFFACACLGRKVFFDLSLNYFRDKPLFYVSDAPAGKSLCYCLDHDISIGDWAHYQLFQKRAEIYYIIYLLLWMLGVGYLLASK